MNEMGGIAAFFSLFIFFFLTQSGSDPVFYPRIYTNLERFMILSPIILSQIAPIQRGGSSDFFHHRGL